METDKLKYPVGKYVIPEMITMENIDEWITTIESLPGNLKSILSGVSEKDLEKNYRPGGWTARQVVHHLADSHMNAFIRFKLALTEENPVIKPYDQARWAELNDNKDVPIQYSLMILEGVHKRWVSLLLAADEEQFKRTFHHPESRRDISLGEITGMYAWHSRHHLEHIKIALN
jgi:hypothetical protein